MLVPLLIMAERACFGFSGFILSVGVGYVVDVWEMWEPKERFFNFRFFEFSNFKFSARAIFWSSSMND